MDEWRREGEREQVGEGGRGRQRERETERGKGRENERENSSLSTYTQCYTGMTLCSVSYIIPPSIFVRIVLVHFRNTSSTFSPVSALVSRKASSISTKQENVNIDCTSVYMYVQAAE